MIIIEVVPEIVSYIDFLYFGVLIYKDKRVLDQFYLSSLYWQLSYVKIAVSDDQKDIVFCSDCNIDVI